MISIEKRIDRGIMDSAKKTEKMYGFMWKKDKDTSPPERWHFNSVQEVVTESLVRGRRGIEVGSGCGYDTYIMAKNNPSVNIVSIDISDGVYKTRELTSKLGNVNVIRCSALDIPTKGDIFDFAYSFGVLHHVASPIKGLLEIARVLRKASPVFLYLYEDHSENIMKYIAVKIITKIRNITVKIPPAKFYVLSWIFSPFVFILFSLPSKILRCFKVTRCLADRIPFNFGTSLFSLRGDLYDRFNAPIEHRFSKRELYDIFAKCGFRDINVTRIKDRAGWVAWGYKK